MSEIRGPGGLYLAGGITILLGAFRKTMVRLGLVLSLLIYGGIGVSRGVSLVLDGAPSSGLVAAMGIELLVGALALIALILGSLAFYVWRLRNRPPVAYQDAD